MSKKTLLTAGGVMAGFSLVFQLAPVFLSELFVLLTVFSALPVYIMCRLKPSAGIFTFLAASLLIFLISPHEGMFFISTNGMVGLSLGIATYYAGRKLLVIAAASFSLTLSMSLPAFVFGINIFGFELPYGIIAQLGTMLAFSAVYCAAFMILAAYVFKRIMKSLPLDKSYKMPKRRTAFPWFPKH